MKNLGKLNDDLRISMYDLNDDHLSILIYDVKDKIIEESYVYYRKGPILIT